MGKIHDRLKAQVQLAHQRPAPRHYLLHGARTVGKSLAVRIATLLNTLDSTRRMRNLGTRERHEAMQGLASEAKKLGLKGRWNMLCNRTQCLAPDALWYNRGSYAFYCGHCADELNRVNARDAERLAPGNALCRKIVNAEEAAELHCMP
jgi:hypothetical protein